MFFVCLMPVMRSSRNVLRSFCANAFLSKCLAFDHACCLPPVRQTGRLAGCSVPIPPWVVIAIRAFSDVAWLSGFVGSLRACAFLYGDPDGERKRTRETENGVGGAAKCVFAQTYWLCGVFRGESVGGCAPPNLRQGVIDSLDSLHLGRGVGAFHAARGKQVQRRLDRLQ